MTDLPTLKAMTRSGQLHLGSFIVEFATPGIGHMARAAGCEFLVVDMEHSGFGFETIKAAVRFVEAAGLRAIVRVPSKAYDHIARAADTGADGIMLPMVGTAKEARAVVDSLKYTPKGHRGVALGIAHDRYSAGPTLEKLAAANERTCFFAQIETAEGVDNADKIAATDGVDCLWVGHFDLSCSLGVPGEFQSKIFLDAISTVAAACRKHKKALGRLVPDVATGIEYQARGFTMLAYAGDVWLLTAALRQGIEGLRQGSDKVVPIKGKRERRR
jgi:2-keto-3-deoxy-L-rhamnonate aldolase RhmA